MTADPLQTKRNFQKLLRIAPKLRHTIEHARSRVPGFMDLNLDVLQRRVDYLRIALSHYYKHPSGDLIADPDIEIAVSFDNELAEALTYQDAFVYEAAYPEEGEPPDLEIHSRLNVFLEHWLDALAEQGHAFRLRDVTTIEGTKCDA
jgi:uncharacterized protein YqiB (DUF1249 family)